MIDKQEKKRGEETGSQRKVGKGVKTLSQPEPLINQNVPPFLFKH